MFYVPNPIPMLQILFLRVLQLKRILLELGLLRTTVLLVTVVFLLFQFGAAGTHTSIEINLVIPLLSVIFSVHLVRNDRKFLKIIQINPVKVFLVEYICLVLPIILLLASSLQFLSVSILIAGIFLISLLPNVFLIRKKIIFHLSFVFQNSYEWMSGFRRNMPALCLLFIASVIFSTYTVTTPLFLLFLTISTCYFYVESEPLLLLQLNEYKPASFLQSKIYTQLKLFFLYTLFFQVIFLIFSFAYWYILIIINLICIILQVLAIVAKYAYYRPNEKLPMVGFFVILAFICLSIPFLSPLPLLMCIYFYRKSIGNLKEYLT